MEVLGYDRTFKKTDWWRVGVNRNDSRAFHCRLAHQEKGRWIIDAYGHKYEAKDINGFLKSAF